MQDEQESLPIKLEPIVESIKNAVPRLSAGRDKALSVLSSITEITNDDELEKANSVLVAVRNTFTKMQELRKPITEQFDSLKKKLMEYEKDLDQNANDNEASRVRSLIGKYNQKKLDEKREQEEAARKEKEKANYKVDIAARIKKNLADLNIERVRQVHKGSKDFFDATTLENFEDRAKQFKNFKPILKQEHYNKCFETFYNKSIITEEEFNAICEEIKLEESYEKISDIVIVEITPVINEWIGKIPQIKQDLVDIKNAADDADKRKVIEEEQKKKAEEEERLVQQQIANKQKESDESIVRDAEVDKLQNEFREQAVNQQTENVGPVELILKFKDEKPVKALVEMIYHCFAHPKFPGIIKVDGKTKEKKLDKHGFPVYQDWVDTIVSFYLKNCDVNINGVEIKEISKVIVRK